jgi:hypothetical protein
MQVHARTCESSDLTSPREPYGKMRDMDDMERGRDRKSGRQRVSVDRKNNQTALTAHLKQRPACLKLRVRGVASLMIAVMHSSNVCTHMHVEARQLAVSMHNLPDQLIYQPHNGHADIIELHSTKKKNPTTRPNNQ